jgi:hypothetical protein
MGQPRHEIGTRRFDVDHGEALLSSNEREMSLLPLQDREIRFGGICSMSLPFHDALSKYVPRCAAADHAQGHAEQCRKLTEDCAVFASAECCVDDRRASTGQHVTRASSQMLVDSCAHLSGVRALLERRV